MKWENNTGHNSTYNKLAVMCYAETFVVNGNLVLRNYIRADWRQLLVAANRYGPFFQVPHMGYLKIIFKFEYDQDTNKN